MEKPDLENIFPNYEILNNNNIEFAGGELEVNLTQLVKGSKMDEDGYLVAGNKKYDLKNAKVTFEVDKDKVTVLTTELNLE